MESNEIDIAARVLSRRDASRKLVFLDVKQLSSQTQIVLKRDAYTGNDWEAIYQTLSIGDRIHVRGCPGRTPAGQLSIRAKQIEILAPCLRRLPKPETLSDMETRARQRYLDMLVNAKSFQTILQRSKLISYIREFLASRNFVEVETPILSAQAGGANARPFTTHMNALDADLQLRIAPELFLKQLVIGGLDRVFEIGKQFRNEGVDATHNPEFTTCEFYQAYGDLESVAALTQELLSGAALAITGSTIVQIQSLDSQETISIDFSQPFKRMNVVSELEKRLGTQLPSLDSEGALEELLAICNKRNINCGSPITIPRLLDSLISELLECECVEPTLLWGHPSVMSPLSKDGEQKGVSERFELFIGGKEYVNAYLELNDPNEQRHRFELQQKDKEKGDTEAQELDGAFCEALEYGLPPTTNEKFPLTIAQDDGCNDDAQLLLGHCNNNLEAGGKDIERPLSRLLEIISQQSFIETPLDSTWRQNLVTFADTLAVLSTAGNEVITELAAEVRSNEQESIVCAN
ncbi:hypothetical protein HDU76_006090 [Blyttiomyces sp. JEL0837]|nr:hypothetical protein HDU76_006090 [Blyttiomyces sp. JEL0837]